MKKFYLFLLLAVCSLAVTAQETTNVLEYTAPEWNDYQMTFTQSDDNSWTVSGSELRCSMRSGASASTLTAKVTVEDDATLCYTLRYGEQVSLLIDGEEVRSYTKEQLSTERNYYQTLVSGEHSIQWVVQGNSSSSSSYYIKNVGIEKTPWITVNLLEPGSLGTEILYNVDDLKDVRCLKIIGSMNDDDWAKISMMKGNLFALDLSETDVKEIADDFFYVPNQNDLPYLHSVKLPEGLRTIGDRAFYNAQSLSDINFPSTLESIGYGAFGSTSITSAILPERCTELGTEVFNRCYFLKEVKLSNSLAVIPRLSFQYCYELRTFDLPEKLERIEERAFYNCSLVAFDFPETLKEIGSYAFYSTNQHGEKAKLILPKNVSVVEGGAFSNTFYTSAEMPVSYFSSQNSSSSILPTTITTLRLNCPTVVGHPSRIIDDDVRANVTLQVPSFLVNSYKLDDYWYNFGKIEGFSTAEIDEWILNNDLVLGARDRFEGTPSITINENGSLKVNGTDGMTVNDLSFKVDPSNNVYGRMFSNADDVVVNGSLWTDFNADKANNWYFISLPYNIKVSDIQPVTGTPKRAIRYYDGANRAENGAVGSWKDFEEDAIIPAGTGFIFQVSEAGWWKLPSPDDAGKQYLTSNNMFVKALAENPSDNAANKGWNLVGNPYQCWYNIHKLNFTAPITVYDTKNKTYSAYSVIDDDYAIAPNQAFFVQCPEGISDISFPLDGRQMTSVIESQVSAKPHAFRMSVPERVLIDLTVSNGTYSDRTRVVFNNSATAVYDTDCDAGKFFSDSQDVPQIYSYDTEGNIYAINERPEGDGNVKLGFTAHEGGTFTFSLARDMSGNVMLKDNERGTTVNLSQQEYSFTADAGTYESRFELSLSNSVTGISGNAVTQETVSVEASTAGITVYGSGARVEVFTCSGVKVGSANVCGSHEFSLSSGLYIVNAGGKSTKVLVP